MDSMSKSITSDCLTLRKARWMPDLTVSRNSTAVMAEPIERIASYGGVGGGRGEREKNNRASRVVINVDMAV